MQKYFVLVSWLAVAGIGTCAWGHGNPMEISGDGSRLMVAVGLSLVNGYVSLASDPHEDAALDFGPNQKLRSTYPGFDISGLQSNAALQFELLGRPDFSTAGFPMRWLWYWNNATQLVEDVPNDLRFDVSPLFGSGSIQVRQSSIVSGPTLTVADPVGPFLGNDQHLLLYELQNSPSADLGAYGVFARFKNPGLESSEPFLLLFRYGPSAEEFSIAAQAINQAAGFAGDFDGDSDVDGRDLLVWQRHFGQATNSLVDGSLNGIVDAADLELWQAQYGKSVNPASLLASIIVPEPNGLNLLVATIVLLASRKQTTQFWVWCPRPEMRD